MCKWEEVFWSDIGLEHVQDYMRINTTYDQCKSNEVVLEDEHSTDA